MMRGVLPEYGELPGPETIAGSYGADVNPWLYSIASIIKYTPRDGVTTGARKLVCNVLDDHTGHINNGDIYRSTFIKVKLNMSHIFWMHLYHFFERRLYRICAMGQYSSIIEFVPVKCRT